MIEYEQSIKMSYLPEPQSDLYCYDTDINYGWEGNFNDAYSKHPETSSLEYVFNKYMEDCSPGPQNDPYIDENNNYSSCRWEDQNQTAFNSPYSTYREPSSLEQTFNSFMQTCPTSPPIFSLANSSSLDFVSDARKL
ncbi:hypothetical protein AHAS_Ahas10G0133200 [Arachis hypogaea]